MKKRRTMPVPSSSSSSAFDRMRIRGVDAPGPLRVLVTIRNVEASFTPDEARLLGEKLIRCADSLDEVKT